jgi:hypothetical protein
MIYLFSVNFTKTNLMIWIGYINFNDICQQYFYTCVHVFTKWSRYNNYFFRVLFLIYFPHSPSPSWIVGLGEHIFLPSLYISQKTDYNIISWSSCFQCKIFFNCFSLMPLSTIFQLPGISWWSVLFVEETGVPGENHRPE